MGEENRSMSQTDLIARLEAEADELEAFNSWCVSSGVAIAKDDNYAQRMADLRAAAAAVRLVGECREALVAVDGCFHAAQVEGLTERLVEADITEVGSLADLVSRRLLFCVAPTDAALAAIAEWEGEHDNAQ